MEAKLVRVQEKGQVTLPTELRKKLGIRKGDLVAVVETDGGILITRQQVVAAALLDRIGQALRDEGVTLEQLMEGGRDERAGLIEERYGLRERDQA
jgi:AbrB family looped-hinge helix DNA binding protein